ncbi:MAG: hypothetical protein KKC75_03160 [Nanoarchaeota archaeon]|nr:hypothetical protein [Nanoarchaeota archaeon]MBU1004788.1 hypothetical protein [Nanoarchaeota archaeon]MBU1945542.1 hypothetical protein [Nanoarchaeota archaeon]
MKKKEITQNYIKTILKIIIPLTLISITLISININIEFKKIEANIQDLNETVSIQKAKIDNLTVSVAEIDSLRSKSIYTNEWASEDNSSLLKFENGGWRIIAHR